MDGIDKAQRRRLVILVIIITSEALQTAPIERTSIEPCAAATSGKLDAPILDTPESVPIINHGLINDQRALAVGDALCNVSRFREADDTSLRVNS